MTDAAEAKLAHHVIIEGDSIKVDGVEFPWIVQDTIRVLSLIPEPLPGDEPLYGVTVTIYTDRVDVIPPQSSRLVIQRDLGQFEAFSSHGTDGS